MTKYFVTIASLSEKGDIESGIRFKAHEIDTIINNSVEHDPPLKQILFFLSELLKDPKTEAFLHKE